MTRLATRLLFSAAALSAPLAVPFASQAAKAEKPAKASPVLGSWNLTFTDKDGKPYPSWIEISADGDKLTGRYCGRFGSAHPLKRVEWDGKELVLAEAAKIKGQDAEKVFKAKLVRGKLEGSAQLGDEPAQAFVGAKSPKLKAPAKPKWGKPVNLITQGLTGWRLRNDKIPGCWSVTDGVLVNKKPCVDIISDGKYQNFKLHLEFKMGEKGANSGVYLRGRHEVQIEDNFGMAPESHRIGGLYGLLTPTKNAMKSPEEWQTYDITLLGRSLTVELNGEKVIDAQDIPGPTGGALDSDEANPGPLMLQGDHGVVMFRNVTLTPAL